ncbi:DUF2804 family protein [Vallitalea maricola]|uniref:Uncharacterized protein n=1 Tax=Vallitalea maricola TaxID=3074433 RepID=A0ACB5UFA2_9FIRM|nr:hypothetical protein AN2V17_03590 [Vallitalea sp. AN17-2]
MEGYTREVKNQINSLVDQDGKFQFGTYNKPVKKLNMLDAKKPLGFPFGKHFKNLKLKEWEAFQAGNQDVFMLGAVYNTKTSALNQLSIYDKRNNKLYNYRKYCIPWKQILSTSMYQSESKYISKDFMMIIYNNLEEGKINIIVKIRSKNDLPNIKLEITAFHLTEPIVICQPFDTNRGLYSHKALMNMEGILYLGKEKIVFDKNTAFTIIDDHKGYYPSNVKYDWVTGCINNKDTGLIGFNLTDNQIKDHEKYNENCLWMNGNMQVLPPIKFKRSVKDDKEVWKIKDEYGMVNILFYPLAKLKLKFNYGIIYSDYEGPMGTFRGYIKDKNDNKIMLDKFFGMGEKKRYRI